mmetsp:Transcript_21799/g.46055  ORF Transcript_21799/g.46055 Transcript_21799/m.46055 type:complete len:144 (-) Transcript_21799:113-544(-)
MKRRERRGKPLSSTPNFRAFAARLLKACGRSTLLRSLAFPSFSCFGTCRHLCLTLLLLLKKKLLLERPSVGNTGIALLAILVWITFFIAAFLAVMLANLTFYLMLVMQAGALTFACLEHLSRIHHAELDSISTILHCPYSSAA